MHGSVLLFCLQVAVKFKFTEGYDGLIQALTNVFAQKHVQTVTVSTCWLPDANSRLVFSLSSVDISVSFQPSVIPVYHTWYSQGILVDVSCARTANALFQQASNHRLFNTQNHWILIDSGPAIGGDAENITVMTFEKHLVGAYILPGSNVFLFVSTENGAWDIWEGFKASKTERIRVRKHGTATVDGRVWLNANDSIAFRADLQGITLKATTVISEPDKFKGFHPFAETDLDIFAHMHHDLNTVLQDQLNFKLRLDIVNSFGWDVGNGSFDGLTGQLQREECDFGGIGSFIREDRMAVVDYTIGTFYRTPAVMFKQPPLSSVRNICVLPFKFEVWMVTFFTFFGFTILIVFLSRITKRFRTDSEEELLTVLDSVTIVHGAICQQGYAMNLNTVSIRVAVFVLFMTAVFLFTSYSASIVALLQSPGDSIKNIRDLVESSMTFSAQISPYGMRYFKETNDPLLRKLYDKKMKQFPETKQYTTAPEGIARIRTEFHGFMVEVVSAYNLIGRLWREEEKCGFSELQLFKLPILALAVIKKSGYKDILKQKLIHQQEVGLKNRILRRWLPSKPVCDSSNRANQFISVSIKEIYPVLQIFVFGLCISIVVLFLEIAYNTYLKRYKKSSASFFRKFSFSYSKQNVSAN